MADLIRSATPPGAPVVHIVDDDQGLREALVRLVRSVGYEARPHGSVKAFLSAARAAVPSCILLDVRLPDMSGLELQANLVKAGIEHPVIMMTGYGDIPMSVRAMKAGAIDFLTKPFRDQDLLDAVAAATARDRLRLDQQHVRSELDARYGSLSQREREVLAGIVDGLMNKEIADRLGLSIVTVKAHRGSLSRKMGAAGAADLVRAAQLLGLDAR
ncbi:MAG: response regulator transcription factor [Sphingomonas sp.]|uniref:response regulator transcription factor n=1 Tax=Sphingomonas sp. TaxID=28214 RepID=UPI001B29ED70|nr:response regulator [Sphingomonas sp.]MBO9623358.1 response regulator transcription factor [Sphingomonas sp.]